MFSNVGIGQLLIIFLIILVLFGAGKIPRIAKDLGNGIRVFKKSVTGEEDEEPKNKA